MNPDLVTEDINGVQNKSQKVGLMGSFIGFRDS